MSKITMYRVAMLFLLMSCHAARADMLRPYVADDVLKLESIGKAYFRANSRELIFELIRSISEFPAEGYYLGERRRAHIYTANAGKPDSARMLFPQQADAAYFLGSQTEDGSKLIVYRLRGADLRLGVYDFESGVFTLTDIYPGARPLQSRGSEHSIWLSADELITTAVPQTEAEIDPVGPAATARRISRLWNMAMDNQHVTATQISTGKAVDHSRLDAAPGSLIYLNLNTGERKIIEDGRFEAISRSPDGQSFIGLRYRGPWADHSAPKDNVGHLGLHRLAWLRLEIVAFRRSGSAFAAFYSCGRCAIDPNSMQWSPDGQRFLFLAANSEANAHSPVTPRLLNFKTQQLEPVHFDRLQVANVAYSNPTSFKTGLAFFGESPLVFAQPRGKAKASKHTPNRGDWFMLQGDKWTNMTSSLDRQPGAITRQNSSSINIQLGSRSATVDRLGNVVSISQPDLDTPLAASERNPTEISDWIYKTQIAGSDEGNLVAYAIDSDTGGSVIVAVRGKSDTVVWQYNEHLADTLPVERRRFTYSASGKTYNAWLLLPPQHKNGKPSPLLVFGYPGYHVSENWFENKSIGILNKWDANYWNIHPILSAGYAFLFVDVDTTPYGKAANRMEEVPKFVLPAIAKLVDKGIVDADKIGLYGGSQNAFVQTSLMCQSDLFKAAVSTGSTSQNLITSYLSFSRAYDGYDDNPGPMQFGQPEGMFIAAPWEEPQRYIRNSPLFCAKKINTPILLMHGDLDTWSRVHSDELYSALHRINKTAQYVIYWGEGHNFRSPANIRDHYRRTIEWYQTYMPVADDGRKSADLVEKPAVSNRPN